MNMTVEMKRLYDAANEAHVQAKAILADFEGKEMPADKQEEVDRLLDIVEAKTGEAKRLERAADMDAFFNDPDPSSQKDFFTKPEGAKVVWNGKTLELDEIAYMRKALGNFGNVFFSTDEAGAREYAKAFRHYLRLQPHEHLSADESKALSAGDWQAGGALVQDTFLNMLLVKAREVSAMRRICNVLPPIPSGAVIVPSEENLLSDAEWTTEIATGSEDAVKPFGQRRLQPYPQAKRIKISNTLLRTPTFDFEAYVRDRMAYKFAVPEENAYINGDGVGKPRGLRQTPNLPSYTTAAALTVTADDIINWVYALPAAYASTARILCNRAFIRKVRLLKDGAGNFIWQPGLQAGDPGRILDTPYELSDRVDDALDAADAWESGGQPAVIGDFNYYWIVDALQMSIQRVNELYAETNQVGFIGRKETDGSCVLPEAFVALTIRA